MWYILPFSYPFETTIVINQHKRPQMHLNISTWFVSTHIIFPWSSSQTQRWSNVYMRGVTLWYQKWTDLVWSCGNDISQIRNGNLDCFKEGKIQNFYLGWYLWFLLLLQCYHTTEFFDLKEVSIRNFFHYLTTNFIFFIILIRDKIIINWQQSHNENNFQDNSPNFSSGYMCHPIHHE